LLKEAEQVMAMTEQQNMMRRLQVQSFVLDDVRLYLDTHPDDQRALAYYQKYRKLKEQTEAEYVRAFGPINSCQVDSDTRWTWVDTPWPWEGMV
jgi:spore coat protein JB